FFSGDSVTLNTSGAAGTFDTKDVGTGKTVTISGLTLNNNGLGDYQFASPQATTAANISAFTLTVSGITADSRAYDNNTDATIHTASASANFFASDSDGTTLNTSAAVGTFSDKHQGVNKTVTISGLTLNNNSTYGDY